MTDTIYARASGAGRSGVAVFRISGPQAGAALTTLTGRVGRPRLARRVEVRSPTGSLVDDGLALWFPAPASFTGEDVAELQLHGSPAVARLVAQALSDLGLRVADAGEFTMRAFHHGKLDLTQVEGLGDLLSAETELQHRQAMLHFSGGLRERAEGWRGDLIEAMAFLDAAVDFPDEDDVPEGISDRAAPAVERVRNSLDNVLAQSRQAQRIASGLTVALVGEPNAGKSSLFNRLLQEERAIVSPEAGTTRDTISAELDWNGHRVTLVDTAGIRDETGSAIEREGIERAQRVAKAADLRLVCVPTGGDVPDWVEALRQPGDIAVRTKADLARAEAETSWRRVSIHEPDLVAELSAAVGRRLDKLAAPALAPSERQRTLLERASEALDDFDRYRDRSPEAAAEAIRLGARALEMLTGRIAPDDILDDIFRSFCIGK